MASQSGQQPLTRSGKGEEGERYAGGGFASEFLPWGLLYHPRSLIRRPARPVIGPIVAAGGEKDKGRANIATLVQMLGF